MLKKHYTSIGVFLTIILVLFTCIAYGDYSEEEIKNISVWKIGNPFPGFPEDGRTPIGEALVQEIGVRLIPDYTPNNEADQALNLKLAGGEWQDTISCGLDFTRMSKLIKAGVLIPLDKYFENPVTYPNLAKISEKVLERYRYDDGHIYAFPGSWYQDLNQKWGWWAVNGWFVHPKYLEEVGMTVQDLETIDGVEKFLKAVKEADFESTSGLPVIPMSSGQDASTWRVVASAFGVTVTDKGFEMIDGKLVHYRDDPRLKQALDWLNALYQDGLIDPEITTHKNENLREKLMGSRIALLADNAFAWWQTITAGETPATKLKFINYPRVPGVDKIGINTLYNPLGSMVLMVTTSCKEPDAVAKYANYALNQSTERTYEMIYGPRGQFWDWDSELGKPYHVYLNKELHDALLEGDYTKIGKIGFSSHAHLIVQGPDLNYFRPEEFRKTLQYIFDLHRFYSPKEFNKPQRPWDRIILPSDGKWNRYSVVLNDLDTEYFARMITSDNDDLFEKNWERYQQLIEQRGHWSEAKEEYIEEYKKQMK